MSAFVEDSEKLKGARLGGYEIVRLIGRGATASVFEATHVALGKQVAIKVLHEHLVADEQLQTRFVREGRIAARLRHPNTVTILDVGVESGLPYLVMELLGGGDLKTLLAEAHLLTLEHALGILLPIASALAQAHDVGVLHRDLKPANIFLSRDLRGDVVPKLVDFGLSKVMTGEATTSLTAAELVAGTVLYMAPEQTLGVKHCSPASDQYSLAAILYECVTGEAPFTADGVHALLERIRTDVARPPSHLNPRLPEAFDDVVLRSLQHNPAKRFGSVRGLARALLPFAGADAVRALERDFLDRASAPTPIHVATAGSASSGSLRTGVEIETRIEVAPDAPGLGHASPSPSASGLAATPRKVSKASAAQIAAPLPCAPGTSPFHIKGISYRGFVVLVGRLVPGGLDAFCAGLDDERLRTFVRQPFLATARYDVFPFVPLYAALARLLDVPFDTLVSESCAAQCRYDTQTVYKAIWANASFETIAERITRFGQQYCDFGKIAATAPRPRAIAFVHSGWPAYVLPFFEQMNVGYTGEALRFVGAEDVELVARDVSRTGVQDGYELVTVRSEYEWRGGRA